MAEQVQANNEPVPPRQKDSNSWWKELGVMELSDNEILDSFNFHREAKRVGFLRPDRMKRISRELSILQTGLPVGIFVRYAESRPDCMKILMVGPLDMPYADGLFEFDLLCPHNYPTDPPEMLFKTTGRGTVRFNPNLYASGKVCLSLLGTWEGPGWNAKGSTILQVLVSIHSMMFNAEPYTNEPGQANHDGSEGSKRYNRHSHSQIVKIAMLGWLEGRDKSIWTEVVKKHFQAHKERVAETVAAWRQDWPQDGGQRSRGGQYNSDGPFAGQSMTLGGTTNGSYGLGPAASDSAQEYPISLHMSWSQDSDDTLLPDVLATLGSYSSPSYVPLGPYPQAGSILRLLTLRMATALQA